MAGPFNVDCPASAWTKVATAFISGQVSKVDPGSHYRHTWRDTGDAPPTNPEEGSFLEDGMVSIGAPSPGIDVYIWCHLKPGKIKVNNSKDFIGPDALGKEGGSPFAVVSSVNSNSTPLVADGVFTGVAENITGIAFIAVNIFSDVVSAVDGLSIQQSSDGVNWDHPDVFNIPADTGKVFSFFPAAKWLRVVYTNGPIPQTAFRLQTILKAVYAKPSSHRIQDSIVDDDDAELVKAVLSAKANGDGFVNITATESNNLRVTDAESIFAIAKGEVVGHSIVYKFGKNADVGSSFEPLSIGGVYQTPQVSGATKLRVKAGNANDAAGGSGARLITIQGLDETGTLVSENLATNGTSAGPEGTVDWLRVFRSFVAESGTYASAGADSCAADIVIETSAGVAWLTIHKPDICRAQSQIGQYTVPLGKTAYVSSYLLTTDSNKVVDFLFFMRESILDTSPPYQARRTVVEEIGVQGFIPGSFDGGQKFTELTDIGWMVKAAAAAQVTVDFQIVLVDN